MIRFLILVGVIVGMSQVTYASPERGETRAKDPQIESTDSHGGPDIQKISITDDVLNEGDETTNYHAIYRYITTVFKKIKKDEAKLISESLIESGKKHDVDPKIAAALIARESGFNRRAISSTGAKGLGQIKSFNFDSLGMDDPYDIQQNVNGTTLYLKRMLSNWKDQSEQVSLALASYYKGPGAMKRSNGKMDRPTKGYVRDILKFYDEIKAQKTR